ncbi:transcription initiation factor TFIID subunit 12-like [Penaeus monodon]|uniref:transcription initiation factor TFIID subunit 12-like n=1 Tax=Penaeus monodon TaxID=6687 RepID=UPI0018A71C4C|nr:transcription initiation factor TFIID subunit 12-like [Penaeus monodon]
MPIDGCSCTAVRALPTDHEAEDLHAQTRQTKSQCLFNGQLRWGGAVLDRIDENCVKLVCKSVDGAQNFIETQVTAGCTCTQQSDFGLLLLRPATTSTTTTAPSTTSTITSATLTTSIANTSTTLTTPTTPNIPTITNHTTTTPMTTTPTTTTTTPTATKEDSIIKDCKEEITTEPPTTTMSVKHHPSLCWDGQCYCLGSWSILSLRCGSSSSKLSVACSPPDSGLVLRMVSTGFSCMAFASEVMETPEVLMMFSLDV